MQTDVSMVTPALSRRAKSTPASPIRRLAALAAAARARGVRVYPLNIGQPDVGSPSGFFEGLSSYDSKIVAYETSQGNAALCDAWSSYVNTSLGLSTRPDDFLVTTGASEALVFLFMTCCDPGDEVVIFDPTYANYIGFAAIAGVTLVPVPCDMADGFHLPPPATVDALVTPRTKAVLLCNPNNPTGTVYTDDELKGVVSVCERHGLYLIVDETYREFVYDGRTPRSILHLEPRNDRVVVVDSLSKRFSLCGARVGCLVTSNRDVLATTLNLAQARLAGPTIEQHAAAHMLVTMPASFVPAVTGEFEARRDALYDALTRLSATVPGVVAHKPEGAFYTIVRLPVEDAEDFCRFLLTSFTSDGETVFLAPAGGFFMSPGAGADMVRMAYVLDRRSVRRAVEIVGAALTEYTS